MPRTKQEMLEIGKKTQFGANGNGTAIKAGIKSGQARREASTIKGFLEQGLDKERIAKILAKRGYSGNLKAIQMILELLGETSTSNTPVQTQEDDPLTKAMEEMGDDN